MRVVIEQTDQDLHAAIARLAEVEWECPCWPSFENCHSLQKRVEAGEHPDILWGTHYRSPCRCDGTGRIAPFKALRVEKQGVWSHRDCIILTHCDMVLTDGSMVKGTTDCEGRGWYPEPDLERACWRLHEMGFEGKTKEEVIQAAEAWVKEQASATNTQ